MLLGHGWVDLVKEKGFVIVLDELHDCWIRSVSDVCSVDNSKLD